MALWAPLCSLCRLWTVSCPIPSHYIDLVEPCHTDLPQNFWALLTVAALTFWFNLCLCCLSCRSAITNITSQSRYIYWLFPLGLGLSFLPQTGASFFLGLSLSLVQSPHCFLPHFWRWNEVSAPHWNTSFSIQCFIKSSFICSLQNGNNYGKQINLSGQPQHWRGMESCPSRCIQPPDTTPAARLQVDQHKSTEDEGAVAHTSPWRLWRGHVTTGQHWAWLHSSCPATALPCSWTPLHRALALHTLPSPITGPGASSCLRIACCLIPLYSPASPAVCLSLHPGGDKQMPVFLQCLLRKQEKNNQGCWMRLDI